MKKILFVLSIAIAFSSCAFHSGYMANSAALSQNNFSYISTKATGESTATYIFGFGGLARKNLVEDAKADLLKTNKLGNGQALANITVNFKNTLITGIYNQVRCTVTADIVQFK